MKHEMPEDLQDFWMFQDAYDKGFEQGRKEIFHELIVIFLAPRFPMFVDLAKERTDLIEDADTLRQILHNLFGLQTAGEVEEYLLSLGDDATKN